MTKREIVQIRLNEERSRKLERITAYLQALGINPKQADAIDFALTAAVEKIDKLQKPE